MYYSPHIFALINMCKDNFENNSCTIIATNKNYSIIVLIIIFKKRKSQYLWLFSIGDAIYDIKETN